jgi:hypothetical protein
MPLITVIIVIALVGFALYVVNKLIPMEATVKQILNVVVILVLIFWLLSLFGLFGHLSAIRIGRA